MGSWSPSQHITAISSKKQKRSAKVATSVVRKLGIAIKVLKDRTLMFQTCGKSEKPNSCSWRYQFLEFQVALKRSSGIWNMAGTSPIYAWFPPSNLHLVRACPAGIRFDHHGLCTKSRFPQNANFRGNIMGRPQTSPINEDIYIIIINKK